MRLCRLGPLRDPTHKDHGLRPKSVTAEMKTHPHGGNETSIR